MRCGAVRGGKSKGEVGQWPVNHRHDVMTRLSFQRLHRRKSFVRNCLPYVSAATPPCTLAPLDSFCGESIRWLQESGGFYVKILQKIMARYTPDRKRMALRSLRSSLLFFFALRPASLTSCPLSLLFFLSLSLSHSLFRVGSELPCTRGNVSL